MRIDKEMTLLEKCKVELEDAVDKFELFDYEYLLDIERVALKYMEKYFKTSNIVHHNESIVRDISLCLKLLNIATDGYFHANNLPYGNEGINTPYVNIRNRNRFLKHEAKPESADINMKALIREVKAWNLYCKIRSNMQKWWD